MGTETSQSSLAERQNPEEKANSSPGEDLEGLYSAWRTAEHASASAKAAAASADVESRRRLLPACLALLSEHETAGHGEKMKVYGRVGLGETQAREHLALARVYRIIPEATREKMAAAGTLLSANQGAAIAEAFKLRERFPLDETKSDEKIADYAVKCAANKVGPEEIRAELESYEAKLEKAGDGGDVGKKPKKPVSPPTPDPRLNKTPRTVEYVMEIGPDLRQVQADLIALSNKPGPQLLALLSAGLCLVLKGKAAGTETAKTEESKTGDGPVPTDSMINALAGLFSGKAKEQLTEALVRAMTENPGADESAVIKTATQSLAATTFKPKAQNRRASE